MPFLSKETLQGGWASLGQPHPPKPFRWFVIVLLAVLFVTGIYWFGAFFDWGSQDLEFFNWATWSAPRYQMLKSAVLAQQLPLHISDPSSFGGITLRYLAVLDTPVSPQYLLLNRTTFQRFNLYNVWLLYALGFAGLLVLKSHLRLSLLSFAALFFLFNFNGHLMAHYGVGSTSWSGYFLIPWFIWLVLRLLDGDRSWALTLGFAAVLLIIWLQGSYTQYAWLLVFLVALGLLAPRTFWMSARAVLFGLAGSAFRFLPATLLAGDLSTRFDGGYPSLVAVWDALVRPADMRDPGLFTPPASLGSWETTAFIGLLGALFLLCFGIFQGLANPRAPYRVLSLPLGLLLLLSTGDLAKLFPLPMMPGESIPSRAFGIVLAFLLVLAADRFQRALDTCPELPWVIAFSLVGLGFILVDLWGINNVWRVSNGTVEFWRAFLPDKWSVQNVYDDSLYLGLVSGGLALSASVFLGLGWLAWRERRLEGGR